MRRAEELRSLEVANNKLFAGAYGLNDVVEVETPLERVALYCNPTHMFGVDNNRAYVRVREDLMTDLVSYAVGCMFGRYSLDEPGLILADQGATVHDYLAKVPSPRFAPDKDNAIPVVEGDWFEDDIVAKFRQFLRAAFGERHFEENLRFVAESLGVKDLRDYFVKSFYKDHVQRYKKRPIYWLFSSPEGLVQRTRLHAPLHAINRVDGAERVLAGVQVQAGVQPSAAWAACGQRRHATAAGGGTEGSRPASQGAGGAR